MAAPGDPVMIVVGGGAIALGTVQELKAIASWCYGAEIPTLAARWRISARSILPLRAPTAPKRSTALVCVMRSRSLRSRRMIS